jgi:adenosylcobinamide kinase / adenosylcobinamide-phosphate guanylyltransferase
MLGKIVLVTGGARSGKSRFAEEYALACGGTVEYIATAEAGDDEMRARVKLHQQRRPAAWRTVEAPFNALIAMKEAVSRADVVLFDCLTIYISNLLLGPGMPTEAGTRTESILTHWEQVLAIAAGGSAVVIIVTNEVGSGIVPDNALGREYRDLAGLANQQAAFAAAEVYLTLCGLAVDVKKLAVNKAWSRKPWEKSGF